MNLRSIKRSNLVSIAIVILAILLALSFYSRLKSEESTSQTHKIVLNENGFSPDKITIQVGDVVKFTTTRNSPFWPASNLHPIHELYPEFDPKKPIDSKESWSFKFDKLGNWRYHDHLAPYYTGEIDVVSENKNEIKSYTSDCQKIGDKNLQYYCWEKQVTDVLKAGGIDAAYQKLVSFYNSDPDFSKRCHPIAHAIGAAAYRDLSLDKKFTVTKETTWCAFGFYHGFMEALLQSGEDLSKARALCLEANKQVNGENSGNQAVFLACLHGIGHGAADPQNNLALWGNERALIKKPLEICEKVSKTDHELYRCAGGVFNVLSIAYSFNQYKFSINKDDPLWICNEQPRKVYQRACYGDMNVALTAYTKNDMYKAAKFIERIKDDEMAGYAMSSLASASISYDPKKTDQRDRIQVCRSVQERLRLSCIGGYATGLAEYGAPGKEYVESLNFCNSSLLRTDEKDKCYASSLGYLMTLFSREDFLNICDKIEEGKYVTYCKNMAV